MNLASFLHSFKEFKDSSLPLPIAPVYSLPSQKWLFSSPTLIPLKKRKENSSFFKYLESFNLLNQQRACLEINSSEKSLLCLYEKKDYLDEKIRHIFNKICMECRSQVQNRQKIRCQCINDAQQTKSVIFGVDLNAINRTIEASKKHFKNQTSQNRDHSINWNEFARLISKQHTKDVWRNEDNLHIYKLPQNGTSQTSVFNLVSNDNYIVFSNGGQFDVNQHMKAKAVELSQLVRRKLEYFLWRKIEGIIQKAEQISDYEMFQKKAKSILKISSLKIWFYKKVQNNQLYVLGLSDLSFKGVECVIFKDANFMLKPIKPQEEKEALSKFQNHKDKTACRIFKSLSDWTHDINSVGITKLTKDSRQKLNRIREVKALSEINLEGSFKLMKNENPILSLTQTQCFCCKDLLLKNEIVNQITANKVQQIRYLRQIKIGKSDYDPYEFVKVCSLCYSAYLKSFNKLMTRSTSQNDQQKPRFHSFYQRNQIQDFSNKNKKETNFYLHKKFGNSQDNSMKILVRDRSINLRAKKQLNIKEEETLYTKILQANSLKKAQITKKKVPYPSFNTQKIKNSRTANTNNTQILDLQDFKNKDIGKDQIQLQRTFTNNQKTDKSYLQMQCLPKSNSFQLKGGVSKNTNIINRIIQNIGKKADRTEKLPKFNQIEQKDHQQNLDQAALRGDFLMRAQQNQKVKQQGKEIINAINQYEYINQPSFKKIPYKYHRSVMKKQFDLKAESEQQYLLQRSKRRKSIFQYFQK